MVITFDYIVYEMSYYNLRFFSCTVKFQQRYVLSKCHHCRVLQQFGKSTESTPSAANSLLLVASLERIRALLPAYEALHVRLKGTVSLFASLIPSCLLFLLRLMTRLYFAF